MRQRGTSKLGLAGMVLAGVMSVFGLGCKDESNNENPNNAPYITTSALNSAIEGQDINTVINATDLDGDSLNFSLVSYPSGATITPIDNTSSRLNWTPTHAQADVQQDFTVRVDDGVDTYDKIYSVTPSNVSIVSGNVNEMGSGDISPLALNGIEVTLGSQSTTTDSGGYWQFNNVPDGSHSVMFKDPTDTYETYKAGNLETNKTSEDAGDLSGLEERLFLQSDRQFINNTIRYNGEIRKWNTKPKFRIYTKELKNNIDVDSAKITLVRDIIKTELTQFCSDSYDFSDADIEEENTLPIAGEIPGYIKIYWDDNIGGGANNSYFNGNVITGSFAKANTSLSKSTWLQELTECLIGGGETLDSNYSDSCLYDPSSTTSYSTDDLKLSEAVYSNNSRPAGNYDSGTTDNHDINPSGTAVTKSLDSNFYTTTDSKNNTSIDIF